MSTAGIQPQHRRGRHGCAGVVAGRLALPIAAGALDESREAAS